MIRRFTGRVQAGEGDAARWLSRFNEAYARKVGMPVFPGSLNLALDQHFDWLDPEAQRAALHFDRSEYGGERDILLLRCALRNLDNEPAWLWTTTVAAAGRDDGWVVELIAGRHLRSTYRLEDGSPVEVEIVA